MHETYIISVWINLSNSLSSFLVACLCLCIWKDAALLVFKSVAVSYVLKLRGALKTTNSRAIISEDSMWGALDCTAEGRGGSSALVWGSADLGFVPQGVVSSGCLACRGGATPIHTSVILPTLHLIWTSLSPHTGQNSPHL